MCFTLKVRDDALFNIEMKAKHLHIALVIFVCIINYCMCKMISRINNLLHKR